jgi:hypothetical protein
MEDSMSLDVQLTELLKVIFPQAQKFWKDDSQVCSQGEWDAMDEKLVCNSTKMVDQVVSDMGVYLSHFIINVEVPCIGTTRQRDTDYFEVHSASYTPATRWEPEDSDPYLISSHGNLHSAFLAFLTADADFKLNSWAEGKAEHEWDVATGGEGGLGVW